MAAHALMGVGEVRHARCRPTPHAFCYPTFFVLLPMRQWPRDGSPGLRRNRWGWLSFYDRDHGDGTNDAMAWLEQLLAQEGVSDADGDVWLQAYPRVLGYAFKPVSFWYCHRRDGQLAAVVAEVNNTFGERHVYLLREPQMRWGQEWRARKVFHVSPFCPVEGEYRFRFMRSGARIVARIEYDDQQGPVLTTSVSGQLQTLSKSSARAALLRHPALTLGVVTRIHWNALCLWLKRVPFFSKPEPPSGFVSRGTAS